MIVESDVEKEKSNEKIRVDLWNSWRGVWKMRTTQILVLVCAGQRPGQRVRECGPARCQHQIRRLLFNRRQDN